MNIPTANLEPPRALIVQVRWGTVAGQKALVRPGQTLKVGRIETNGLAIPSDFALSETDFELTWDGERCLFQNLSGRTDTLLNGEPQQEGVVPHGAWLRAGTTTFSIYHEAYTLDARCEASKPHDITFSKTLVLDILRGHTDPLYAVLDSAADPRVLVLLRESVEECRSLYQGPKGDALEDVAPYLVHTPIGSKLLGALLHEGWGQHWGIYLTSSRPFHEVRKQLRRFLMVQDDSDQELYFRFYDPRVLQGFLSTCSPVQRAELFESISCIMTIQDGVLTQHRP
jgi:hypothetical protein